MNPVEDEQLRKLEQALIEAHRTRQAPQWESGWVEGVMREVHLLARRQPPASHEQDVTQLVWRTAGFAAALAALLMVTLLMGSPKSVSEEAGLMAEDVGMGSLFFE